MGTNNFFRSDLYRIYNIVESSMLVYPKEIIIATLRDFFSHDSYYHFQRDDFGFPNTTDHTGLPLGADMPYGPGSNPSLSTSSPLSTRLFIGENYRWNAIYYPAILVKAGGSKYVPISINREKGSVKYENIIYEDGYGNSTVLQQPKALITSGAWEGQIIIDVLTRSLRSRDELVQLIAILFTDIVFETLVDIGIIVKPINIGSPNETDDRNDKLYRQSLTLDIRTEWRRAIPISTVIDSINFIVDFGTSPETIDPNLTIETQITYEDFLESL